MRLISIASLVTALLLTVSSVGTASGLPADQSNPNESDSNGMFSSLLSFTQMDREQNFLHYAESISTPTLKAENSSTGSNTVGTVIDSETNEPIENVELITNTGIIVKTDRNGRFQVKNLPDGKYTWTLSAKHYLDAKYKDYPVLSIGTNIYLFKLSKNRAINTSYGNYQTEEAAEVKQFNNNEPNIETRSSGPVLTTWPELTKLRNKDKDGHIFYPGQGTYLAGVVSAELYAPNSSFYNGMTEKQIKEAFKAMAVAANSYAEYIARYYPNRHSGYNLCATSHCQAYDSSAVNSVALDAVEAISYWPSDGVIYYDTLMARRSSGYQFFETPYFASCKGQTKNNEDVWGGTADPHLRSVSCPYDMRPNYANGHGVGMCQDGIVGMAKTGKYTYLDMLFHYYQDSAIYGLRGR